VSRVSLSNASWIALVGAIAAILAGLFGLAATGMLEPDKMHVQARRLADALMPAVGRLPAVLTAEKERILKPGDRFQECWSCPEMVVVPAGEFMMGSTLGRDDEQPVHKVTIAAPLAVGRFEVTFDEWDGCIVHGGCPAQNMAGAKFGRGRQPVINVSWDDAQTYVMWLSKRTGKTYRLLTEAEWEYAARAANDSEYSFGNSEAVLGQHAWFRDNSDSQPHAVGGKKPNAFFLYDMHGNVWEWVEDCYVNTYAGAPTDGSARPSSPCDFFRVLRGGTWNSVPGELRSATRDFIGPSDRGDFFGFRVMRVLPSQLRPAEAR
jgi:formylglycine-generating enzyme required for sulfatase activity